LKVLNEIDAEEIIKALRLNGFVILDIEQEKHDRITRELEAILGASKFESLHESIEVEDLNTYRLELISRLTKENLYTDLLLHEFDFLISSLVGMDVAIQKTPGLSLQLPHDESSLLPMHSDSLVGNSPYELVLWHPITEAINSSAMYILPLEKSLEIYNKKLFIENSIEDIYNQYSPDFVELNIVPGQLLIFSHNLLHGNRINNSSKTRVSINTRIKNLFTPYGNKELGSYFRKARFSIAAELGVKFDS